MRIEKVFVRNYGPLKNGQWDIDTSVNVVVLFGHHGAGKSTFLNAIDHCLSRTLLWDPVNFPVYFKDEYSVEIKICPTCEMDEKFLAGEYTFTLPANIGLENRCIETFGLRAPYGVVRPDSFIPFDGFETEYPLFQPGNSGITLLWYKNWYKKPFVRGNPIQALATSLGRLRMENENINSVLQEINHHLSNSMNFELIIKNDKLCYRRLQESTIFPTDYLSEGESFAIGLLLLGFVLLPPSGILIIDSPETYLHPAAQHSILSSITSRLKDGQVIITTHSPSIIASRNLNELYFLERTNDIQKPKKVESDDVIRIIRGLYGKVVSDSVFKAISDYSSSSILTYLIQCYLKPEAISRQHGDPQIQQLATWLLGYTQPHLNERITVADIGAGHGDLLYSIKASGCTDRLRYVPIEPNMNYWDTIKQNAAEIVHLESMYPIRDISDLNQADIIFFINILHELDLPTRIELLSRSLHLIHERGVVVIHEVSVLPIGEANFVMWNSEDIKQIFKNINIKADIATAKTFTRPGGWPLETICIRSIDFPPDTEVLMKGAVNSLSSMLARWTKVLEENEFENIKSEMRDKLKAFRMAQVANICVWCQKYQKNEQI